jgi:hypothetical protein
MAACDLNASRVRYGIRRQGVNDIQSTDDGSTVLSQNIMYTFSDSASRYCIGTYAQQIECIPLVTVPHIIASEHIHSRLSLAFFSMNAFTWLTV